jgi:6-phosphogluconolactonase
MESYRGHIRRRSMQREHKDPIFSPVSVLLCVALALASCAGPADPPPKAPSVSIGSQSGRIPSGFPGVASFTVSTVLVDEGTIGSISWYADPEGTVEAGSPENLTVEISPVASNAATISMSSEGYVYEGDYYFKVAEGDLVSSMASLKVTAALSQELYVGAQSGELLQGKSGSATFLLTVKDIDSSADISWDWYTAADGQTPRYEQAGVTVALSPLTGDKATITLTIDESMPGGDFYFKMSYRQFNGMSIFSPIATLRIISPTVVLGPQSGRIGSGFAGSASFAATTSRVDSGVSGSVAWYSDAEGTVETAAPAGLSANVTPVSGNAATLTATVSASAAAGSYYFRLKEGVALSPVAVLSVETPTVSLGAQNGYIRMGFAGSASFAATTDCVPDGVAGTIAWYSDAGGTAPRSAPAGLSAAVTPVSGNAAQLTISAGAAVPRGKYYFKLLEGSYATATATLLVSPSYIVYAANVLSANGGDVSAYSMDPTTGELTSLELSPFPVGSRPYSITVHPDSRSAYFALNSANGGVGSRSIDPASGRLSAEGSSTLSGPNLRASALDPTGKFLYVATSDNNLWAYSTMAGSRSLSLNVPGSPFATGSTPYAIATSATGFAYAVNYGDDSLSAYSINAANGSLSQVSGSPFALGASAEAESPRCIAITPDGKFAYIGYGNASIISAFSLGAGTGVPTQLPGSPIAVASGISSLCVDPSGSFLFAANLNSTVSVFRINAATGELAEIPGSPFAAGTAGTTSAEAATVDPSGKFLFVSVVQPSRNGKVYGFSIDASTGGLGAVPGSPFDAGTAAQSIASFKLN